MTEVEHEVLSTYLAMHPEASGAFITTLKKAGITFIKEPTIKELIYGCTHQTDK